MRTRPIIEVAYGDGRVERGELISFGPPELTPVRSVDGGFDYKRAIDGREITFQTSISPPMIRTLQLEWLWNNGGTATISTPEGTLNLTQGAEMGEVSETPA